MTVFTLLFSTLFVILIDVSIQQNCSDPNFEEFSLTALPVKCQPACYVTNVTGVTPCPEAPAPGCVCKSGNIRTNNGRCIYQPNCPPPDSPCPTKLQEYNTSIINPLCQQTCNNVDGFSPCFLENVAGCQCIQGAYRDLSSNRCYPLDICPTAVTPTPTQLPISTTPIPTTESSEEDEDESSTSRICLQLQNWFTKLKNLFKKKPESTNDLKPSAFNI